MTNAEKFKEVFGYEVRECSEMCNIVSSNICDEYEDCEKCPIKNFWINEFKPKK